MVSFGIGQAVRRVEDRRFLTGRGSYVDDIELPRQCHAVAVLSTHAHARIKRIDVAAARAAPGVALVLTGVDAVSEDIGGIPPHFMPEHWGGPKGFGTCDRCFWRIASAVSAIAWHSSSRRPRRRRAMPLSWSRSSTSRCRP